MLSSWGENGLCEGMFQATAVVVNALVELPDEPQGHKRMAGLPVGLLRALAFSTTRRGVDRPPMVGNRWRVLVCGLAGFGTAAGLLVILTLEGGSEQELKGFRDYWFFVGLLWGLPAAVCSWLSGLKK